MPPGDGSQRLGRQPGALLTRAGARAAAVLARAAPSSAPRVARRDPAADNALPGATSRAAARQAPAWRPPPRAGPSAPKPAPPSASPSPVRGAVRAQRRPPPHSALPAPPSPPPLLSRVSSPPFRVSCTQFLPRSVLVLSSSLAGKVREGPPQLGCPENFQKLGRVAAHHLNPLPARPQVASTRTALIFHLTKWGAVRVFKDSFCGAGFLTPLSRDKHYRAQGNVGKLFHF